MVDDAAKIVTVKVDGIEVEARQGEMVIAAAERSGVFIPRFCYHPRMKPVGMCRMCLVEISGPRGLSLQPACYVQVSDGQEVVTTSDKVQKAQEGVLEFLLANHPLDCPVCDKGGECPLQDQTLAYGPGETRFVERKRHWAKPIALSGLVELDRERCIQCARCTRFADEIAGEALIDFYSRGDSIEVATFPDSAFSSYFSGNTVQICPVGALTARPYRFAARPWDLEQVESTCTACSMGCRVVVQSSSDEVIRLLGVDSEPVNHSWLCDKGRFSFEANRGPNRLGSPMVRHNGTLVEASWSEALRVAAKGIEEALERGGPAAVGVIGGARLTNEDAYAWVKLAKGVWKTDSVDAQLGDGLSAEVVLGLPRATIDEAAGAPVVITIGPDLREEIPVLFLRLRTAAMSDQTKLIELCPVETSLTRYAACSLVHRPGEASSLVEAIVAAVNSNGEEVEAAGETGQIAGVAAAHIQEAAAVISEAIAPTPEPTAGPGPASAPGVVIVYGRQSLADSSIVVEEAVALLAEALPSARFLPVLRRGNVNGALDAGMAPGVLPGRVGLDEGREWYSAPQAWSGAPDSRGNGCSEMLARAAAGELRALVMVGADPLSDFPDGQSAERAIESGSFKVAVTSHLDRSASLADVVLPVAMYGESAGTTTNIEGRVTALAQKVTPYGLSWQAWEVASALATLTGAELGFESLKEISEEMARLAPVFKSAGLEVVSDAAFRDGVVVPVAALQVGIRPRSDSKPREVALIDPMATPGIGSLPHQVAPGPDRGNQLGALAGTASTGEGSDTRASGTTRKPEMLRVPSPTRSVPRAANDSYSLRLVSTRKLYDDGTLVAESAALAVLAPVARLRTCSYELDRLGVRTGDSVRVSSPRAGFPVEVEVDESVPKGVARLDFNLPGAKASALIDCSEVVTEIRLERVEPSHKASPEVRPPSAKAESGEGGEGGTGEGEREES